VWPSAHKDARTGKAPTTQAGEFVREEMHHIREDKHGARNTKQAIAIGLSVDHFLCGPYNWHSSLPKFSRAPPWHKGAR
jgi:hypothetical protein